MNEDEKETQDKYPHWRKCKECGEWCAFRANGDLYAHGPFWSCPGGGRAKGGAA